MLTEYIQAAMKRAHYELIENGDEPYYGEIPGVDGVWAVGASFEATRAELQSVLESWLLYSLGRRLVVPVVDGIDLNVPIAV